MNHLPIYLKTDPQMPRPADEQFYLVTGDGTFMGRNHPFFSCDVPARKAPRSLSAHRPWCHVRYPKLPVSALEYIVGFFDQVYELHGSESIVLLYWNQLRQRYKLCVPPQEATVWESSYGRRAGLDVSYEVPTRMPPGHLLVADIHCHCDFGAHASYTDEKDELHRDGVHAIVGHIDREPPEFQLEISIDGCRFTMSFDQLFKGYRQRRSGVPQAWLNQLHVKVNHPYNWSQKDSSYEWKNESR